MKTKLFITAVFLACFAAFSLAQVPDNENKKCNFDVQLTSKNLIVVRYLNADNDKIKIKVYNENDDVVQVKTVKARGNIKLYFDMINLPEGEYSFQVFCNKQEICVEEVTKFTDNSLDMPRRLKTSKMVSSEMYFTNK